MTYTDRKEYMKAWRQAHRDEIKAYKKAWEQAHGEEIKAWEQAHRDERKAYKKAWRQAHRDEIKAYQKAWQQAHKEEIKAYYSSDTNSLCQPKHNIRCMSNKYLFKVMKHTKIKGYEIHHCFGYDNFKNFIYIPRELHLQIHQFLRDNGIDADSNHYSKIEHLIVNYLKLNNRHVLIMNGEEDKNA